MSGAPINIVLRMPRGRRQWTITLATATSFALAGAAAAWAVFKYGYMRHEDTLQAIVKDAAAIARDVADTKADVRIAAALTTQRLSDLRDQIDKVDRRIDGMETVIFRTFGAKTAAMQQPLAPAPRLASEVDRQ